VLPSALALAAVYALASLLTLIVFGVDKARARRGERRVPERTLHLLELCCGWPGALVAMQLFRHKRRKPRYWVVTALIALSHLALLGGLGALALQARG
jgi:uncharacterized membrane protein YsdA (DUF1294 family)